eukprot:GHRQ01032047.1.p1 GENE.GHRQ01032047.1~~GHRQ01032047.1.p1  ORF type:complete len:222 (+),score=72.00 GHRQ01032047.1:212-877(+)
MQLQKRLIVGLPCCFSLRCGTGSVLARLLPPCAPLMCAVLAARAGAQGLLDVVSAACLDEQASCVVLGDSAGHLRVYDISAGIDASSSTAARAGFKQRAHWQAHTAGVSSVDYVPARPFANSMCGANGSGMVQPLIASAGRDSNVAVWTLDGGFVGLCGDHSWDLDKEETWRDAGGLQQRPPQPAEEGMFIKVGCEAGGADSAAAAGWRHCQQLPTMSLLP